MKLDNSKFNQDWKIFLQKNNPKITKKSLRYRRELRTMVGMIEYRPNVKNVK